MQTETALRSQRIRRIVEQVEERIALEPKHVSAARLRELVDQANTDPVDAPVAGGRGQQMGFRFYRRVHVLPGVRVNFGTRGASVSVGHRGAWLTTGAHGRRRATLGFPGTGMYYTATSGTHESGQRQAKRAPSAIRSLFTLLAVVVLGWWVFLFAFGAATALGVGK